HRRSTLPGAVALLSAGAPEWANRRPGPGCRAGAGAAAPGRGEGDLTPGFQPSGTPTSESNPLMPRILAFAEAREGTIRPVAREAVAAARALTAAGDEVEAVVLGGAGVGGEAAGLGSVGASRVHVGESDALKAYSPEAYTTVLAGLVRSGDYRAVVFP